jgi:membrane protease YdiL (CAAX protease family)
MQIEDVWPGKHWYAYPSVRPQKCIRKMTNFNNLPVIEKTTLLCLRMYVAFYCIYPLVNRSEGLWGWGMWAGEVTKQIILPIALLFYVSKKSPQIWIYTKEASRRNWSWFPSIFLLAFVYWITSKVVYYHVKEVFPTLFDTPLVSAFTHPSDGMAPPHIALQATLWIYASLSAGIVEELVYKLLLLLCLPRSVGIVSFTLISSLLFMVGHVEQSWGSMLLKGPMFAIPTAIYFYKTRNLGSLFLFHVFIDLFLSKRTFFA